MPAQHPIRLQHVSLYCRDPATCDINTPSEEVEFRVHAAIRVFDGRLSGPFGIVAPVAEVNGQSLNESFEVNDVLTTWRNLANEQVIYPLAMQDMTVKLGHQRQLFLDNYLVTRPGNASS